jgi:hypothetical protein
MAENTFAQLGLTLVIFRAMGSVHAVRAHFLQARGRCFRHDVALRTE